MSLSRRDLHDPVATNQDVLEDENGTPARNGTDTSSSTDSAVRSCRRALFSKSEPHRPAFLEPLPPGVEGVLRQPMLLAELLHRDAAALLRRDSFGLVCFGVARLRLDASVAHDATMQRRAVRQKERFTRRLGKSVSVEREVPTPGGIPRETDLSTRNLQPRYLAREIIYYILYGTDDHLLARQAREQSPNGGKSGREVNQSLDRRPVGAAPG